MCTDLRNLLRYEHLLRKKWGKKSKRKCGKGTGVEESRIQGKFLKLQGNLCVQSWSVLSDGTSANKCVNKCSEITI